MKELKEGDVVLCAVEKIVGTTVFVKIEGNGQGSIVVSEIAPGRIRNLRDYVVPNKKIVCKILRVGRDYVTLSLRRVVENERKEVLDRYEKEKSALSILRSILKDKAEETAEKIKKESNSLNEFFQNCKESPDRLKAYLTAEQAERVCKILSEKKEKKVEIRKEFTLKSNHPDGIKRIKRILDAGASNGAGNERGNESIKYIAANRFVLSATAKNFKEANTKISSIINEIEKRAKQEQCEFSLKEK